MNVFFSKLDRHRIEDAITTAELRTSGEIRVAIHHAATEDPVAAAREEFARLGMNRTHEHNAVLILVAPDSRSFAIFGDQGVHERCGDAFWSAVATEMTTFFKKGAFTEGLIHGIDRAGRLLGEHFPRRPDDRNELSNTVIERYPVI